MFYRQLKKLCEFKGIKLTPLIKDLGLTTGNIGRWKQGGQPSVEVLQKFADYFEVSTDFLLGTGSETDLDANVSPAYLMGSDGTHKHLDIPKDKVQDFLAKYPATTLTAQQQELIELWEKLDPIEQAEFRGQLKGYIKAKQLSH